MPTPQPQLPETAALLNPAFGAYLLAHCAAAYSAAHTEAEATLPWPTAFLALPLILPPDSRRALPRDTRTQLAGWLADHALIRAAFPQRAPALHTYTQDCIRFGIRHATLTLTHTGIRTTRKPTKPNQAEHGEETTTCVRAATLVGRWFAATDPATVFTLLGVRP
ncbi:three component ABC system middle component [Kitasatospora purpeofusca]|uniref:three component ABC system middle component n=1 Tax=Kitasatospora purpeofusca TaxID=67352 RepID=UPI0038707C13|nr:DUF6521 family protein [Kitasatospora purpeofusca]